MNIFAHMTVIRLTKEFSFEAAHALDGYDGPCREIHGHSYRLFVTVKGCPAAGEGDPKCGMVMDFGVLKRIVNEDRVALRPLPRPASDAVQRVAAGHARRTFRQHRHGGLPADLREYARRFRPPHFAPTAGGRGAVFAPPA